MLFEIIMKISIYIQTTGKKNYPKTILTIYVGFLTESEVMSSAKFKAFGVIRSNKSSYALSRCSFWFWTWHYRAYYFSALNSNQSPKLRRFQLRNYSLIRWKTKLVLGKHWRRWAGGVVKFSLSPFSQKVHIMHRLLTTPQWQWRCKMDSTFQ